MAADHCPLSSDTLSSGSPRILHESEAFIPETSMLTASVVPTSVAPTSGSAWVLHDSGRLYQRRTNPVALASDTLSSDCPWVLHESEAFIGKASEGKVVGFYFEPSVTPHMEASGSPAG